MSRGSGYLTPRVLDELERLHGHLPENFQPREWIVTTPAGEYPVPPSVQALLAVEWPADQHLRTNDEFEWEVVLYSGGEGAETEPGLVIEDRAWYTIGHDQGQWYLLVDLAEAATTTDLVTYRVDHEGGEPVPMPIWLSDRLSDLERSTAAIEFGRACAWGDVEKVRAALEGGIGTGELEQSGLTPLHLATFSRSPETVQILLDAGADPNAVLTDIINANDVWSTYCETYRSRTTNGDPLYRVTDIDPLCCFMDEGETPLHRALKNFRGMDDIDGARASLLEMVRLMLAGGAKHTIHTAEGLSSADIAFSMTIGKSKADAPEEYECLQMLYDAGAELDAYADWSPNEP